MVEPAVGFIRLPHKSIPPPYFSTEPTRLNRSGIKEKGEQNGEENAVKD